MILKSQKYSQYCIGFGIGYWKISQNIKKLYQNKGYLFKRRKTESKMKITNEEKEYD